VWAWVCDFDPAVLGRDNDFWGSFAMVVLFSVSHCHRGQFRVLPGAMLVWVGGSALLWFFLTARRLQQRQPEPRDKGRGGRGHSSDFSGSLANSSVAGSDSTSSLAEYEDCEATPPTNAALAHQTTTAATAQAASAESPSKRRRNSNNNNNNNNNNSECNRNSSRPDAHDDAPITLLQVMGTMAYCALPLTLAVGGLRAFRRAHTQYGPLAAYGLQLVGVAWASRAGAVALRARTQPSRQPLPPLPPEGAAPEGAAKAAADAGTPSSTPPSQETDGSNDAGAEAAWRHHDADHQLLCYPIVLFNIYLVSLYTHPEVEDLRSIRPGHP
jgi:hypothetical protein